MPPLLWTLDQSRFSFPRGFYSLLLSDDTFNDFIASATGEFLSINNNISLSVMGISQSLSMSADHFFFSSSEQNAKSKLQRETGKQGGRKRGRRAVKGRGSDSKPCYCPPARQHVVTELANNKGSCFYILGDNTVYPYSSGSHLTPQTFPVAQRHDVISQTRKNNFFFFYCLF